MSIVKDILKEEKKRLILLIDQLESEILSYPKGSLSRKKRGKKWFYYIAYRKGSKVIFKYLGKENSPEVNDMDDLIQKRRNLEKKLRNIKNDLKDVKKGLGERQ